MSTIRNQYNYISIFMKYVILYYQQTLRNKVLLKDFLCLFN